MCNIRVIRFHSDTSLNANWDARAGVCVVALDEERLSDLRVLCAPTQVCDVHLQGVEAGAPGYGHLEEGDDDLILQACDLFGTVMGFSIDEAPEELSTTARRVSRRRSNESPKAESRDHHV